MTTPPHEPQQPIESFLTVPPEPRPGVCAICRGIDYTGGRNCGNCRDVAEQLSTTLVPIWPASMYKKPSSLRDNLTHYKPNQEGPVDHTSRPILSQILRDFIQAIPREHMGIVDVVTTVPSTIPKDSPHPLLQVAGSASLPAPVRRTLVRDVGELGHGKASRSAFTVLDKTLIDKQRVLLIDDVYTTGARAQSAAFALRTAGAAHVRLVVIARRLNLDYHERVRVLWDRLSANPYTYASAAASITPTT